MDSSEIPDNIRQKAEKMAPFFQRRIFKLLSKELKGLVVYKYANFKDIKEAVDFLNTKHIDIIVHAILPDFKSYEYVVVYEEETNGQSIS